MERKTFKSKTKTTLLKEVSLMSIWSLKLSIKKNMDYSSIPIIFLTIFIQTLQLYELVEALLLK